MGIYNRKGSLEVGKDADMVMLDRDLNVVGVWNMGRRAK
jgi:N-acetylglucosamine-6-phosphate deacetylase